jgi:general secretion pathway protein G
LGFTLLELMMAVAVVGLLSALALPTYSKVIEGQKIGVAQRDLMLIASALQRYRTANDFKLPDSLAGLKDIPTLDPWKRPYQYLNHSDDTPGTKGKIRKDHNLHPINSEYDLYSMGMDGQSVAPLTASASRDDIVYARDGAFIGKASEF